MWIDGKKLDTPVTAYTFDSVGNHTAKFIFENNNLNSSIFEDCTNLIKFILPDNINLQTPAFYGCSNLQSFGGKYASSDGKSLIIDGTVKCVAPYNLTEYTLPQEANNILLDALIGCNKLTDLYIPSNMASISPGAVGRFPNSLKNIYVPSFKTWCSFDIPPTISLLGNSNISLYVNNKLVEGDVVLPEDVNVIGTATFAEYKKITSIVIPDSVNNIGAHAFRGCSNLENVIIGNGAKSIPDLCFYDCKNLKSIKIGKNITYIGNMAFEGCSKLEKFDIPSLEALFNINYADGKSPMEDSEDCVLYINGELLTNLVIPEGVTKINKGMFKYQTNLTNVTFPDSLIEIGEESFYSCSGLNNKDIILGNNVTTIGSDAFRGVRINKFIIPESVTKLDGNIFSVEELYVNTNLIETTPLKGDAAGGGASKIIIGNNITKLCDNAFAYHHRLGTVIIPNSITEIGDYAFRSCASARELNFYCNSIVPPTLGGNVFYDTTRFKIYVPSGSLEAYKTAQYWSEYADSIEAMPDSIN